MPRPASTLWTHFRRDGPNKRAICRYCQHNMCGLVTRMRAHLARKCTECPVNIKSEMFEADLNRNMDLPMPSAPAVSTSSAVTITASPPHTSAKKPRRGRLPAPTAMDEKAEMDSYVAKAILGGGLPVSTIENPSFIKMIKRMSPGYELPNAFSLASMALDLEFTEVQLKLRAEVLDATSVCLGVESWSTSMERSIISFVINTPNPGVFAFESTGESPHTTEVLVEKIESVMTQIGTGKVSVIVMDLRNESMKQAAVVLEGKYPNITFLPSCAHAMNAMMDDILATPAIANTLDICKQVTGFFSHNPIARAAFTRVSEPMQALEGSYPLSQPSDSSATASLECLLGVQRNHHSLEILLAENRPLNNLDGHAKEQIINLAFWDELATNTSLLEPFMDMLKTFESDYPLLSTFYHRFNQLWAHVQKYGELGNTVREIMSEHWQTIRHPAMYTAYILDPRFPDAGLHVVTDATSEVLTYLKRSADTATYKQIVTELTRYTGRVGMFADDAVWESAQKCSPIHWWKGFIGGSVPHLQAVALRNLCFPASSGLSKSRREMFERIHQANAKYMNDDQANKAAVVYLNTNLTPGGDGGGVSNETLV